MGVEYSRKMSEYHSLYSVSDSECETIREDQYRGSYSDLQKGTKFAHDKSHAPKRRKVTLDNHVSIRSNHDHPTRPDERAGKRKEAAAASLPSSSSIRATQKGPLRSTPNAGGKFAPKAAPVAKMLTTPEASQARKPMQTIENPMSMPGQGQSPHKDRSGAKPDRKSNQPAKSRRKPDGSSGDDLLDILKWDKAVCNAKDCRETRSGFWFAATSKPRTRRTKTCFACRPLRGTNLTGHELRSHAEHFFETHVRPFLTQLEHIEPTTDINAVVTTFQSKLQRKLSTSAASSLHSLPDRRPAQSSSITVEDQLRSSGARNAARHDVAGGSTEQRRMSTERIESYPPPEVAKQRMAPPQPTESADQRIARTQEGRAESPESPTIISPPELRDSRPCTPDVYNDKISSKNKSPLKDTSSKKATPKTPIQPKSTGLPTPESKSTHGLEKQRNALSSGKHTKATNDWPIRWPPTPVTPVDPRAPAAVTSPHQSHEKRDDPLQDLTVQHVDSDSPDTRPTADPKDTTPTRPARAPNTKKAATPPAKFTPQPQTTPPPAPPPISHPSSPSPATPLNEIAQIWQTIATESTNTHRYRRFSDCGRMAGEYLGHARAAQRLFAEFKGECDAHERRVVGMMGMGGGGE